jgi:VanZ family protein
MAKLNDRSFYFARIAVFVYLILVAFVSLNPFHFDFSNSLMPWDWLFAPTPKYIPIFDVQSNIIAYLPLGFLTVFALYPRLKKWSALFFSVCLGILYSGTMESLQTYLPTRIPSLIDLYSNGLGMLLGALFAIPLSPAWLSGNRVERLRESYFGKHQGFFIILLLCMLAQTYPQNAWLGMGDLGYLFTRVSPYWEIPIGNTSQEILITALSSFAIGSFALFGMKSSDKSLRAVTIFFILMFLFRAVMVQFQFRQEGIFQWWDISLVIGFLIGYLLIYLANMASKKSQWYLATFALILQCVIVNLLPKNPYFLAQLEQLRQGNMIHLNGLLGWISMMWPYAAILFLFGNKNLKVS